MRIPRHPELLVGSRESCLASCSPGPGPQKSRNKPKTFPVIPVTPGGGWRPLWNLLCSCRVPGRFHPWKSLGLSQVGQADALGALNCSCFLGQSWAIVTLGLPGHCKSDNNWGGTGVETPAPRPACPAILQLLAGLNPFY